MAKKLFLWYSILFPFILFLNVLTFGGKSFGIGTILFYFLTVFQVALLFIQGQNFSFRKEAFIFLVPIIIFIAKAITTEASVEIKMVIDRCIFWLTFLFNFILSFRYADRHFRAALLRGFSYGSLAAVVIGILHFYFFYSVPFIDTTFDTDDAGTVFYVQDYDLMRFRETAIYFGANINGYFTVLGFVAFCFYRKYFVVRKPDALFAVITAACMINILNSDSRSALLIFCGFTLFMFFRNSQIIGKLMVFSIVPFVAVLIATLNARFSLEGVLTDPRLGKLVVTYLLLSDNPVNWVWGVPVGHNWTLGDIAVSDNMYAAILLSNGLIGLTFFIWFFIHNMQQLNRIARSSHDNRLFANFVKIFLSLFFISGFFSISLSVLPFVAYLGIFLGAAYKNN